MALDWSNERYVRLYRETPDEAAWCWQARAIWPLILRSCDRAGVIETGKGPRGVAAAIRMPVEVVDAGLPELIEDGCLTLTDRGYMVRNYIHAQTATSSNTRRQAEWRARERAKEHANRNDANGDVTDRNASETDRNETSRPVDSDPIRAEPNRAEQRIEREAPATPVAPHSTGTLPGMPPVKAKRDRRPSAVALPADFTPAESHRTFAAVNGIDLDREVERFRLHHEAKGSTFASWNAALGTWLRNAVDFRGSRAGPSRNAPTTPASSIDATAQALRERGFIP